MRPIRPCFRHLQWNALSRAGFEELPRFSSALGIGSAVRCAGGGIIGAEERPSRGFGGRGGWGEGIRLGW